MISVRFPGASAIFRRYLVCCRDSSISLADATEKHGIKMGLIIRELGRLTSQEIEMPDDPKLLVDLLVVRYHDAHRRELHELVDLAERVERAHADHPDAPKGLAEFLERMAGAVGDQMEKEEFLIFPMIRAANPMVTYLIPAMQAAHDDHREALNVLAALTNNMQSPENGSSSWRALYAGLRKLSDDLVDHIYIENNILFPRLVLLNRDLPSPA